VSRLREKFQADLDEIARDLIRAHDLKFTEGVPNLNDPLSRWVDFRLRYIDPIPRTVFVSNRFPRRVSAQVGDGLAILTSRLRSGSDVNAYQSKGLTRFNDFSGRNTSKRTDLLWADWGITHLHVTDVPLEAASEYSKRCCSNGESWLLFCLFAGDTVGLIDLKEHNDRCLFSDQDLIHALKQNWPDYLDNFRLHGILPDEEQLTDEQIGVLRQYGVNAPIVIDGEMFMGPGMGVASSSTPTLVTERVDRLRMWINWLADSAQDEEGPIVAEIRNREIKAPALSLSLVPSGISLIEETNRLVFVMNYDKTGDRYSAEMESLICPQWALDRVLPNEGTNPTGFSASAPKPAG